MNKLLRCSLIITMATYIQGCGALGQVSESEYISPVKDISLDIGESAIVHGAMEQCGLRSRSWSDISHLLPHPEIGFFSSGGNEVMKSRRCGGPAPVLAVQFTATKAGSESLKIFGDTINIVVGNNTNFLESGIPNPKKSGNTDSSVLEKLLNLL